jgi:hypothetical protein
MAVGDEIVYWLMSSGECSSVGLLVLDGDIVQYVDLKRVRQKSNDFKDFLVKEG